MKVGDTLPPPLLFFFFFPAGDDDGGGTFPKPLAPLLPFSLASADEESAAKRFHVTERGRLATFQSP